jgi:hypothetical protein
LLPFPNAAAPHDKNYVRPEPNVTEVSSREVEVLLRALDPVPQDRWGSCVELMQRLHDCCAVPVGVA